MKGLQLVLQFVLLRAGWHCFSQRLFQRIKDIEKCLSCMPFAELRHGDGHEFRGCWAGQSCRQRFIVQDSDLQFECSVLSPYVVGDEALVALLPVAGLIAELKILAAELSDASAEVMEAMSSLVAADLSRSTASGTLVQTLPTGIESLNLFGTPLTDKAVPALAALTNLQCLFINDTEISATGVSQPREALPDCEIVAERHALIPVNALPKPVTGKLPKAAKTAPLPALPKDVPQEWTWISPDATVTCSSTSEWSTDNPDTLLTTQAGDFSFHSASETEPWLMIDLGTVYTLAGVEVVNRPNLAERTQQLYISLSSDLITWHPAFVAAQPEDRWLIPLEGKPSARFIRIGSHNDEPNFFHLKGVRIFGHRLL